MRSEFRGHGAKSLHEPQLLDLDYLALCIGQLEGSRPLSQPLESPPLAVAFQDARVSSLTALRGRLT